MGRAERDRGRRINIMRVRVFIYVRRIRIRGGRNIRSHKLRFGRVDRAVVVVNGSVPHPRTCERGRYKHHRKSYVNAIRTY